MLRELLALVCRSEVQNMTTVWVVGIDLSSIQPATAIQYAVRESQGSYSEMIIRDCSYRDTDAYLYLFCYARRNG